MNEKRKETRNHLAFYLQVRDRETGELVGHLADISCEGVLVISENPIEVDAEFSIQVLLSEKNAAGAKRANLLVKSLWCKRDVNPSFFATGFKIKDSAKGETRAAIEAIKECQLSSVSQSIN
jgi:hypothetical protein